jgi:zinc protease
MLPVSSHQINLPLQGFTEAVCNPYQSWQRRAASVAAATLLSLQASVGTFTLPPNAVAAVATQPSIAELFTSPDVVDSLPPLPADFKPLPPPKLPQYRRIVLKNGLRVILLEDHEAPIIRGVLLSSGGTRASPPEKVGLASIAAASQRAGGSNEHPAPVLDEMLEDMAASIEIGAGPDALTLGFSCLAEDARRVMGLFNEVLTDPACPEAKVEQLKRQALNSIAHKDDNPSSIPAKQVAKLVYGADSPYAREPTLDQIASITTEDVKTWLLQWERPDIAVLGIVGDFKSSEMETWVKESLGTWKAATPDPAPVLPTPALPDFEAVAGKIYLIDRPDATQASIAVGEPGIRMMDPDECALDVLSDLMNSFGGRLFDGLRSREGLAYSVGAGWPSAPLDHKGLFVATAETAQPVALLRSLRSALQLAVREPPSVDEVTRAREESLNSFVFSYSTSLANLRRAVAFELKGIPDDYPFRYLARLKQVSPADVQRAAALHLHPDKQVTVLVVGDAKRLQQELSTVLGAPVEIKVPQ